MIQEGGPLSSNIDDERAEQLINKFWAPIAKVAKTRGNLRKLFNAERIVHNPKGWKGRMGKAIEEHTRSLAS